MKMIMATIFVDIPDMIMYLEDIVVHGLSSALPEDRLSKVFDMLGRLNITLNKEKCIFAVPIIEYVGFRLTTNTN